MADFSQMSDAELLAMRDSIAKQPSPSAAPVVPDDLSLLSDDDLLKMRDQLASSAPQRVSADGVEFTPNGSTVANNINNLAKQVANGVLGGWADKFAGYMDKHVGYFDNDNNWVGASETDPNMTAGNYGNAELEQSKKFADEHPFEAGAGNLVGTALSMALGTGVLGRLAGVSEAAAPSLLARIGSGAAIGSMSGASMGAGQTPAGESPINPMIYGAGIGGALGLAAPVIADAVISPAIRFGSQVLNPSGYAEGLGTKVLSKAISQDLAASPEEAEGVLAKLQRGQELGKPVTLADVGGENARGLASSAMRQPGEGGQAAKDFLLTRDRGEGELGPYDLYTKDGALDRVAGDLDKALPSGDAQKVTDDIIAQQKTTAAPFYDQAFKGGSEAPLQGQFENWFNSASKAENDAQLALNEAQNKATMASAGVSRAGDNVYMNSSSLAAQREAEKTLQTAQQAVDGAANQKQAVLERLRKAQEDGTANAPGAVWSPRIQQFLDDPILQSGLKKGLEIQRLESLSEGKPYNPMEFAVTGTDEAGNPIVGSVPNMRLLDAGKRGLDTIISENTDPITQNVNEYGRSVNMVRKSYLNELDDLSPKDDAGNSLYAQARAAWAGPARSTWAIQQGRNFFNMQPSDAEKVMSNLAPEDVELFKLGAKQAMIDKIQSSGDGANEVLKLLGNTKLRNQVATLFDGDLAPQSSGGVLDRFKNFREGLGYENQMNATGQYMTGNSPTAPRLARDQAYMQDAGDNGMGSLMKGVGSLAFNEYANAGIHIAEWLKNQGSHLVDPKVSAVILKKAFSTDPEVQKQALVDAIKYGSKGRSRSVLDGLRMAAPGSIGGQASGPLARGVPLTIGSAPPNEDRVSTGSRP